MIEKKQPPEVEKKIEKPKEDGAEKEKVAPVSADDLKMIISQVIDEKLKPITDQYQKLSERQDSGEKSINDIISSLKESFLSINVKKETADEVQELADAYEV